MANAYLPRTIDSELDELLMAVPALSVEGVRGVGKTATCLRRAKTSYSLEDANTLAALDADLTALNRQDHPVLIDEWQRLPQTWDYVRQSVDRSPQLGRFLLTGSANPPTTTAIHTGAGRIASLHMRPMALFERAPTHQTVSLRSLLTGDRQCDGKTSWTLADYAEAILQSGLPGIMNLSARGRRIQLQTYLNRLVDHDVPASGAAVRRPDALKQWLRAYAAASSLTANYTTIRKAATAGEGDQPARSTVDTYRSALSRLWLLEPVPAWNYSWRPLSHLATAPKHQLADPAFAAAILGLTESALLKGAPLGDGRLAMGQLFESLVTLSIRVAGQAAEAKVGHLRTRNGDHEVDLIVEGLDGALIACEVKLTANVGDDDVKHLIWLRKKLGDNLTDTIVITTGTHAYRRGDGVAVIPLSLLGP